MSLASYLGMATKQVREYAGDAAILEDRLAAFRRILKEAGVRLTVQRLEVFREVAGREDHPDADAVFRAVRRRMPAVSLDTVHRVLQLLRDLGVIAALGPRHESVRFDANLGPHDHYVCLRCGRTRDIEGLGASVRPRAEAVAHLGSVVRARVEVQGICRACAKELEATKGNERRGGTIGKPEGGTR